jgi:hypothetical protein
MHSMRQKHNRSGLVLVVFLLLPLSARTQTSNPALSDHELDNRLGWIQYELSAEKSPSLWWWYGWVGGYSALTVAQTTVLFVTPDTNLKQTMGVGAVESLLGLVGVLFTPLESKTAADSLRALPDTSREERENKLPVAERLLRESAGDEAFGRSWVTHALGFAVNLTGGLVIWQGFHQTWLDGLLNFALGMAITEVQIFTQPTRAIHAYGEYRQRYAISASIWFMPKPAGLVVALSF